MTDYYMMNVQFYYNCTVEDHYDAIVKKSLARRLVRGESNADIVEKRNEFPP